MLILDSKTSLAETFQRVRSVTTQLTAPLIPEDTVVQPIVDVSPPKWHLAHTTWFFEQFILNQQASYSLFDESFPFLFNSYYESLGERVARDQRGFVTRPGLDAILAYREYVDSHIQHFLENEPDPALLKLLELGLNHEQQHQELLLTDIKYILGHQPLFPPYKEIEKHSDHGPSAKSEWLDVQEGLYEIGFSGDGFAFDNEYNHHKVYLSKFSIMSRPVSCGEYIEFIDDGGYEKTALWLADGWSWRIQNSIHAPEYWNKKNNKWYHYDLSGLSPVAENHPVSHISFYEADAFARWKGCRLPTEQEWEVAAILHEPNPSQKGIWLDANRPGTKKLDDQLSFGGNVWEWTQSAYLPYPGFKSAPGPEGEYNGKWMSGQMVLRGGSCATPFDHYRHTYRNFFPPDKRWQFSGIRLAK